MGNIEKAVRIEIPQRVNEIITTLQSRGFEAYVVGGCVRDSILGRKPEDWDITTSAKPDQIKELFERTVDTGIEHGTVTVMRGKEGFEVTTYRIDGDYEDGRHPKEVLFTGNLHEDLLRRDFTINAMAYNDKEGLQDIFGGMEDLENGVIRCVGNARERFSEDALRILRAVRFSAQLGFDIHEDTKDAIRKLAGTLRKISAERIQTELVKLLVSPHPELLLLAYELGITNVILPEFDRMMETTQETPHHMHNVGVHTIEALKAIRADKVLRLTMLFHDMGKPEYKTMDQDGTAHFKKHAIGSERIVKDVMRRLKFDNDTTRKVSKLVLYHDCRMPAEGKPVRRAMKEIGQELFPAYLEVRMADTLAQSTYHREEKIANIKGVESVYKEILRRGECVSLKELHVNGKDLISAGIMPGKEMGEILNALLAEVVDDPGKNEREYLISRALEMEKRGGQG